MAAGGVGPAQHQAPNSGGAGTAAATPLHSSTTSTVNGDGHDSDGYSFAPP
jgi:hypothetical protein